MASCIDTILHMYDGWNRLTWSRHPTTSGLNPSRHGIVADISPEVLSRVHVGDSTVTTYSDY